MERSLTGSSNVTPLRGDDTPPRTPPHNYEAEQALLGAILVNNRVYDRVTEFLRPEHFADALHGRIYEAIGKLIERGQIANSGHAEEPVRPGRRRWPRSAARSIWCGSRTPSSPSSTPRTTAAPSTTSSCAAS